MPQLTAARLKKILATVDDTAIIRFADMFGQFIPIEDDWEYSSNDGGLMTLFEQESEVQEPIPAGHKMSARERAVMMRSLWIAWNMAPEMRFMQLMINAIRHKHPHGEGPIPFYVEDERLIHMLEAFLEAMLNQGDVQHSIDLRTLGSGRDAGPERSNQISPGQGDASV